MRSTPDKDGNTSPERTRWENTTAIARGNSGHQWRRRWTFQGIVRVNAIAFPWVRTDSDLCGRSFYSPGVEQRGDETRLLLFKPARLSDPIDAYLMCIRSGEYGKIEREKGWKSPGVRLIAASGGHGGPQEFLLLFQPGGWILTDQGYWVLEVALGRRGHPMPTLEPRELLKAETQTASNKPIHQARQVAKICQRQQYLL